MNTLRDIEDNPDEYLGDDTRLFISAALGLMGRGYTEEEAIDAIWGNGDFVRRAEAILRAEGSPS